MSTPRHGTCELEPLQPHAKGQHSNEVRGQVTWYECIDWREGVAAPLEPAKLTPRLFYESWRCAHYAGITQVTQIEQLVFFVATIALLVIYGFWADKREHR